jgi:hypothetical protein
MPLHSALADMDSGSLFMPLKRHKKRPECSFLFEG